MIFDVSKKMFNFAIAKALGEMAEWSIAAVLKTVEGHTSGGSNPSLSAAKQPDRAAFLVVGTCESTPKVYFDTPSFCGQERDEPPEARHRTALAKQAPADRPNVPTVNHLFTANPFLHTATYRLTYSIIFRDDF